jgi:hypothetical protein
MSQPAAESRALREEVEAAVIRAAERMGSIGIRKSAIVGPFLGRGVHKATLYRWVDATLASGRPGQAAVRSMEDAVIARAARGSDPTAEVVAEVGARLPAIPRFEEVAGRPTFRVMEQLNLATDTCKRLIRHCENKDGGIRNAPLMLKAADKLRACTETAVRIQQNLWTVAKIDQIHRAIIEEIAKEAPPVAERLLRRIDVIAASWS